MSEGVEQGPIGKTEGRTWHKKKREGNRIRGIYAHAPTGKGSGQPGTAETNGFQSILL